jgi:hypothetical protein
MDLPGTESPGNALKGVAAAFAGDARSPEQITTAGVWYDEGGRPHAHRDPERDAADRFFSGRPWTEITAKELLAWGWVYSGMIWLTPGARAYYLPAYLKAILTAPPGADWVAALEALALRLIPPAPFRSMTRGGVTRSEAQRNAMDASSQSDFQQFVDASNTERPEGRRDAIPNGQRHPHHLRQALRAGFTPRRLSIGRQPEGIHLARSS